jgi:hypothetical protein
MRRTLVIAPQWIGDAVMTQPLMACLHARGEAISVAALPWVAPVYRAMPQVTEVIELPFAHGRLDWAERRDPRPQLHQGGADSVAGAHCVAHWLSRRRPALVVEPTLAESARQATDGGVLQRSCRGSFRVNRVTGIEI